MEAEGLETLRAAAAAAAAFLLQVSKEGKKTKNSPPLGSHCALDFTAQGLCHLGFLSSCFRATERSFSFEVKEEEEEKKK